VGFAAADVLPAAPGRVHPNPQRIESAVSPVRPSPRPVNRLAHEKSPYLLQHRHNPVDWHAWGEEAFARARAEDKPIFLSIGYSTCHWCHVMERESFEDEGVAAFLNGHFVSIKVDREERPDVDKIYMTFVQATTGQGGWPLNVLLTPELKPFFGGTYYPPETRGGRPGFLTLLREVQQFWETRRGELVEAAAGLYGRLAELAAVRAGSERPLTAAVLQGAAAKFKEEYDPRHGGFGGPPKFPRPSQPACLLRCAAWLGDREALRMVLHTCDRMAAGGLYDQLGGGFARYSVDGEWLVPHFEKMLYDNAQLVPLYLEAYLVSGEERHATVAREVIRYVLRDLTHPAGGFYSAEDADSEGKEGKFYCWTRAEMAALLEADEFKVAARYFGVTEGGNFSDHSDPDPLPGQNVLSVVNPSLAPAEESLLASAKKKLFAARSSRVRPHLDDKVLASWNGLMLGALARAAAVLGEPDYRQAAERNLAFLQAHLWDAASKTLYHRWRDGERDRVQLLDAYAFLLAGVLELYQATLEPAHLEFALDLAAAMLERFYDTAQGGFWQSGAGASELILRIKEDYDGAEPSGNSVAALALLKLGALTGRTEFHQAAERTLRFFSQRLRRLPQAMPHMLQALDFWLGEPARVAIAGPLDHADTQTLLRAAHSVYRPNQVVLGTAGPVEPFARTLTPQDGRPTAYVCTGTSCQPPTQAGEMLRRMLRSARP